MGKTSVCYSKKSFAINDGDLWGHPAMRKIYSKRIHDQICFFANDFFWIVSENKSKDCQELSGIWFFVIVTVAAAAAACWPPLCCCELRMQSRLLFFFLRTRLSLCLLDSVVISLLALTVWGVKAECLITVMWSMNAVCIVSWTFCVTWNSSMMECIVQPWHVFDSYLCWEVIGGCSASAAFFWIYFILFFTC